MLQICYEFDTTIFYVSITINFSVMIMLTVYVISDDVFSPSVDGLATNAEAFPSVAHMPVAARPFVEQRNFFSLLRSSW